MPWYYIIKMIVIDRDKKSDLDRYADNLMKKLYVNYKTFKILKKRENEIEIIYGFKSGKQITDHKSAVEFIFDGKPIIKSLKCISELNIKHPNYLEYVAKKRLDGENPLSRKEFYDKIYREKYLEDL